LANSLLVCRSCAFNFDTPGVFSDVGGAAVAFFLRFDDRLKDELSVREGSIRDRVEKKAQVVRKLDPTSSLSSAYVFLDFIL
jgi:hypothetical protein